MHNDLLAGLALVVFLGMASQLIAWRFGIPSILLLLGVGIFSGPITGLVNIDALLGELLFPVVSLSIAIILFEGGLSLRVSDLRDRSGVVWKLIAIGVPITWVVTALSARFVLGLQTELALLLGAILIVTGPTVIIPMLKQIRPEARVGSILRWEGIIIDPVGALLAVLVFEEILVSSPAAGVMLFIRTFLNTVLIGGAGGWLAAKLMVWLYSRYIIPYPLQSPATLMFVIVAFTISNLLEAESGLATVTVMGFVMANQERVDTRHIVEFKENLQIILISILFVVLAARLQPANITILDWRAVIFIAIMILVTRPLAVYFSTLGSDLNWREKVFISWMAPRGIVAAAVSSIFAAELALEGFVGDDPNLLVSYTFAVIISTVTLYSLTAGWLARWLELTERYPQGILMLGAHNWARQMGDELQKLGFRVIMADSNPRHIDSAQRMKLDTYYGNILSEIVLDEIDFGGIGRMLAVTPNHEVNSLASLHFSTIFNKNEVYQLMSSDNQEMAIELSGRHLFGKQITYDFITQRFREGARIQTMEVQEPEQVKAMIEDGLVPLFVVTGESQLNIWTEEDPPTFEKGDQLVTLTNPKPPEA